MNSERQGFAPENPENTSESNQFREKISGIVDSAIGALPIYNQLVPEKIDSLRTSMVDTVVNLDIICNGRWKSLSVINDYIDTINNHVLVVDATDPSQVLCDLEGICQQEALQGIRNKRRHVKKAFGETLNMLQTDTNTVKDCKNLQAMNKRSEYFSKTPRISGWRRFMD